MVRFTMVRMLLFILLLAIPANPSGAEELTLLGGGMLNVDTDEASFSWQLDYRQDIGERLAVSISYLNEGHVDDHHRDGHALTLWTRTGLFDDTLTLAVGGGPYFYFDTTASKKSGAYEDNHGWGALFSLAATVHGSNDLLYQLRINGVKTFSSIDSVSILAGIGYDLESDRSHPPSGKQINDRSLRGKNEITVFLGQTVVNSFNSDKSIAASIEFRRRLARYLDVTAGWVHEGDNRLIRRNGANVQIWGVRDYLDKRISVGIGGGMYVSIDRYYDPANTRHYNNRSVSGIITLSTSYLVTPEWSARVSWHRIVTNYDRDTDVLLAGIGYRF